MTFEFDDHDDGSEPAGRPLTDEELWHLMHGIGDTSPSTDTSDAEPR